MSSLRSKSVWQTQCNAMIPYHSAVYRVVVDGTRDGTSTIRGCNINVTQRPRAFSRISGGCSSRPRLSSAASTGMSGPLGRTRWAQVGPRGFDTDSPSWPSLETGRCVQKSSAPLFSITPPCGSPEGRRQRSPPAAAGHPSEVRKCARLTKKVPENVAVRPESVLTGLNSPGTKGRSHVS